MIARIRTILCLIGTAGMLLNGSSARAGTVTYDFTTDPTKLATNPIEVYQTGFADGAGNSVYWKDAGGNPGGFLGLTWPIGSSSSIVIFPDIDPGKVVTAFTFDTDLRIGNPQQNVRAADGFSINFARSTDPVFETHDASGFATSGAVETGTSTGLAISFDTWAGNALPDGADIEGIIVRVDNKTVLRQAMPTRNGLCADTTSLQTGPRQDAYWDDPDTGAKALGTLPDAAFLPETWTNLCWQHLSVVLDDQAKLTVTYKGLKVLDAFQTTFFPSAGQIVLAGRTGGADEHGHFDNLTLTTTAATDASPPTAPANLVAVAQKPRKVALTWDAATDDSGRVAYNVERDGTNIASLISGTNFTDRTVLPAKTYSYKVQAADPAGNKSVFTTAASATTPAEVLSDAPGTLKFEVWNGITGVSVDLLTSDPRYPDAPDFVSLASALDTRTVYADDSHENYGGRLTGWLTPTATADYDFFLRSDDASQLLLSTDATAGSLAVIAEETGCCDAYHETGAGDPETTAAPIHLLANTKYYIEVLWKEGGGGDYAQVAWRKTGDTTAAAALTPIPGTFLSTTGVDITAGPPVFTTSPTNQTIALGGTATFSAEALYGEQPITYQWQHRGTNIPGATTKSVTVSNAGAADSGGYTLVASNVEGSTTSPAGNLAITGLPTEFPWSVGIKDAGWPVGNGGGPNATFVQETGAINALPGSPNSPEVDAQADNDYYFAGVYTNVISSITARPEYGPYTPVGVVSLNEEAAERAFAAADNDLRYHFNLPSSLQASDLLSVTFAANNLDTSGSDARYGIEVYFNGVLVQSQIVISNAILNTDFTTTNFSLASVNAQTGLGPDNIVSLRGINYNSDNGGNWMGIDYVKLNSASTPPVTGDTVTNGLVAYWNFDGNLLDSIQGLNGTGHGTNPVAFVDGKAGFGQAINLDGTDQFVEITGGNENSLEFPRGSMSIAGWFKVNAFDTDWQALLSKGEDLNYRIARRGIGAGNTNTIAYAGGTGEGADDVPSVNDGQWHHFVAISDAATNEFGTALYVDGVRHGVNAAKPVLASNSLHLFIGENPGALGRQWNGQIDDIAIWNRVLTSAEVSTLYNAGTGTPLSTVAVAEQNVILPGDTLIASSTNTPAAEIGPNAVDNKSSTKYLNFDKLNTGFTVTPSRGSSVITGIALTSANDAPERDPASYKIEGSNDGTTFVLVSEGTVGTFTNRFIRQTIHFANTNAYTSYRITFPTVVNATTANSMQIAEVELLGTAVGGPSGPEFTGISVQGNNVVITWAPASAVLQSATLVDGPYTDVAGAAGGTYSAPLTGAPRFFRLK